MSFTNDHLRKMHYHLISVSNSGRMMALVHWTVYTSSRHRQVKVCKNVRENDGSLDGVWRSTRNTCDFK